MADPPSTSGNIDLVGKVAPRALYYVAIDGTDAMDSVAYGELLENKYGWNNLLQDFLEPATDDPQRLVDPAHPYLPICLFKAETKSKKVAVVCPHGRNSHGQDSFWRNYSGEEASEQPLGKKDWTDRGDPYTTYGRATAAEKSADFMSRFILDPTIETQKNGGQVIRQLVDGASKDINPIRGTDVFRADLLLISSHGWLGGFMRGNMIDAWPGAQPSEARGEFIPRRRYFVVGKAAKLSGCFFGPQWIILAQCSTLNSATWSLWTQVLSWSDPTVRGILAYEEASPDPEGSIGIAKSFFAALKKKTILEAWQEANRGEKWAAIVHKEALQDRMGEWRSFKEISETMTTATSGSYIGFLSGKPSGEEILDVPPPFKLKLESLREKSPEPGDPIHADPQGDYFDITPDVLDLYQAALSGERWYRVTVSTPAGSRIVAAKFRWIHIRPTYNKQFKVRALFQECRMIETQVADATADVDPANDKQILVRPKNAPLDSVSFLLQSVSEDDLRRSGIEAHHSYLWPHIELTLESGTKGYDFKVIGLSYYG